MAFQQTKSCTIDEINEILTAETGGMMMLPSTSYDEVHPNILIGDEGIARNRFVLKRVGVTHILNAAMGDNPFCVNTGQSLYSSEAITFLGLEAIDMMSFDLSQYFYQAADFIEDALKTEKGKLLVHCREGISRSSTIVLAFLMIKCHMTVQEAVRYVRRRREICPNDGFIHQLCQLNDKLLENNHFNNKV